MKKPLGWKACPSIGGRYAVAKLLEGGTVGNGLISFATKQEADDFIESGGADELDQRGRL